MEKTRIFSFFASKTKQQGLFDERTLLVRFNEQGYLAVIVPIILRPLASQLNALLYQNRAYLAVIVPIILRPLASQLNALLYHHS